MKPPAFHPSTAELFAALHGTEAGTLTAIARDFSPRFERHACTRCLDVVIDVSGLGRLVGDGTRHRYRTWSCRGAAGRRRAVSNRRAPPRACAGGGIGGREWSGDLERALGVLPIAVLQQLMADAAGTVVPDLQLFDVLSRWGLRTLGDFAALPAADLSARLGQRGVALQQLARGLDARPLVPDPGVLRFVESLELEWPLDSLEPLSFVFARLLDPLSAALERADRGAAAIHLDLRLTDRTTHTRLLQLPVAMRDPRILRTLLLLDLESHPPAAAVDVVTIEADPAPGRILQYSLLERALPSAETLATLSARLGALVGSDRCGVPTLLDTYMPDTFRLGPAASLGATASMGSCASNPSTVMAPILRRCRPPVAIRVTLENGRPVRIAIDRQGMPGGGVTGAAGPWRTSGAWWDQSSPDFALRASSRGRGIATSGMSPALMARPA